MTVKVIATDMDGTFLTDSKTYDKDSNVLIIFLKKALNLW